MLGRLTILVLLVVVAGVAYKAWAYRKGALSAMNKVEVISERFTKSDFFEAENRQWLERGERPDVVFMGASITKRWNPEGKLGALKVAQRGVGGQWPSHYLLRFASDVLDLKPRAVVIKACAITFRPGVDEKGTRRAVLDMCAQAEAAGVRPVLATCVPVREDGNAVYGSDGKKQPSGINDRLLPYNDWLRQLAAEHGWGLIDFYQAMADEKGFLPADLAVDDIHPNDKGYEVMTATARAALEPLLAAGGD